MAPPALPGFSATMTLSEAQASRDPIDHVGVASTGSGLPPITQIAFSPCRAHYPGGPVWYTCRLKMALSRAGIPKPLWPSRNERPVGIHNFPFEACSSFTRVTACGFAGPPNVDFCHKASIPAVTHRNGSLAIQAYRQLLEWDSHPLVICAVGARVRFANLHFWRF